MDHLLLVDGRRVLRDGVGAVARAPGPSRGDEAAPRRAAAATALLTPVSTVRVSQYLSLLS